MGDLSSKIDTIIQKRKKSLEAVQKALASIEESSACVNEFEKIQQGIRQEQGGTPGKYAKWLQTKPEVVGVISSINLLPFRSAVEVYQYELKLLEERFSRDHLHISFVGRAGHGKSLVLQNISGLKGDVIPSADGQDCTGARSIITNHDGKTYARITFFSEEELVAVVNKYLHEIGVDAHKIYRKTEIPTIALNQIKQELRQEQVFELAYFDHLKKYVENYEEYSNFIGTTQDVAIDSIERYVAQFCSANQNLKYYVYLAVKEANILCDFPHKDIGKIVLVDTIGLGATSLGVEEGMLEAIEQNSDAVTYMLKPEGNRDRLSDEDLKVIKLIYKKLPAEYVRELVFCVLNRVEHGKRPNVDLIPGYERDIHNKGYSFASVLNVDCSSSEDVGKNLLTPILNRMVERVEVADKLLLDKAATYAEKVQHEFSAILHAINGAFVGSANEDVRKQLYPQIKKT